MTGVEESSSPGSDLPVQRRVPRKAAVTVARDVSLARPPVVHIQRRLEVDVALTGVEGKVSEGAVLVVRKRLLGGTVDARCPVHERLLIHRPSNKVTDEFRPLTTHV